MKQRTASRNHLARPLLSLALVLLAGLFLLTEGLDLSRSVYAADATRLNSGRSARSRVNVLSTKSAAQIKLSDTVILATNSIALNSETDILSGDVVANNASPGPFLNNGVELSIGQSSTAAAGFALRADSMKIVAGSVIASDVIFNDLTGAGAITGTQITPIPAPGLPFFPADVLAACGAPPPRPNAENFNLPQKSSLTIVAGEYGDLVTGQQANLTFAGGEYIFRSLSIGQKSKILFQAASIVRVEGKIDINSDPVIGPAPGSGIGPSDILIVAGGINGTTGALNATPQAASIGQKGIVSANFCVPNGTLDFNSQTQATGSFLARDVAFGQKSDIALDSFFKNQPPTANQQSVTTEFIQPSDVKVLTLTGSDPEGGDLTFSIVSGPAVGTLNNLTPIIPDEVTDPETLETVQPPVVSATVEYSNNAGNIEDSFTFKVIDPEGAEGMAVVTINPFDPSPPPPAVTTVTAFDFLVANETAIDTAVGTAKAIGLGAGGPPAATLVFRIETGPTGGSLTDSAGGDITAPQDLSDKKVVYTPPPDVTGTFSFTYSARTAASTFPPCSAPTCDTATVEIVVSEPYELAPDSTVTANLNEAVKITLQGNPGGTGNAKAGLLSVGAAKATGLPGAAIAGNVSDSTLPADIGDGKDPLPGPAPVLISAGVDVNLTSGPKTWTFSGVAFDDGGTASGMFDFNASTGAVTNWSVSTTAGTTLGAHSYTPADSSFSTYNGGDPQNVLMFSDNSSDLQFRFTPIDAITAAGGTVALNLDTYSNGSGGTECLNCSPFRKITAGSISSPAAPAVQGVTRIEIEWDLTTLGALSPDDVESASVELTTNRGSVDSLDTQFFVGAADQNGTLDESDFQAAASPFAVPVIMPVFGTPGVDGTFGFNVTSALKNAVGQGFDFFSLQGRVNESLADGVMDDPVLRGLQIRSTAGGNLVGNLEPRLNIVLTSGIPPAVQLTWTIGTLPTNGTLRDLGGNLVTIGQVFSERPTLVYTPSLNFVGTDSFLYDVAEGVTIDSALIQILVTLNDQCALVGRPPGCAPSF